MSNRALFLINVSILMVTIAAALVALQSQAGSISAFDTIYLVIPVAIAILILLIVIVHYYRKGLRKPLKNILILLCIPYFFICLNYVLGTLENTYQTIQYNRENKRAQGIDIFKNENNAALAQAIFADDTIKMKSILQAGADVNGTGEDSITLLLFSMHCVYNNADKQPWAVKILLNHGANPNARAKLVLFDSNLTGLERAPKSPLSFCINASFPAGSAAANDKSELITEWLLKAGAKPDLRELDFGSFAYGNKGMMNKLKLLLKYGADVNTLCPHYYVPDWYLKKGADSIKGTYVNTKWTPIMKLAERELWPEVLYLLQQGAKTDYKDAYGTNLETLVAYYTQHSNGITPQMEQLQAILGKGN